MENPKTYRLFDNRGPITHWLTDDSLAPGFVGVSDDLDNAKTFDTRYDAYLALEKLPGFKVSPLDVEPCDVVRTALGWLRILGVPSGTGGVCIDGPNWPLNVNHPDDGGVMLACEHSDGTPARINAMCIEAIATPSEKVRWLKRREVYRSGNVTRLTEIGFLITTPR